LVILFAVCGIVVLDCSPKFCRGTGQTTGQNGTFFFYEGRVIVVRLVLRAWDPDND